MSVDSLAAELGRYVQLYRAKGKDDLPLWRSRYPAFPPVICVLAAGSRAALERRRDTVLALLRSHPDLRRSPEVSIRICLAEDLADRGPFAPIFLAASPADQPLNWLVDRDAGGSR